MRRTILRLVIVIVPFMALAVPASAGGWATVRLDEPPGEVVVEVPWALGFTVMQHDVRPANVGRATVFARHRDSGEALSSDARQDGPEGHYRAELTFPSAGQWKWGVRAEPFGEMAFETLTVLAKPGAARPVAEELGQARPAGIATGTCDSLGSVPAFSLADLRLDAAAAGVPVESDLTDKMVGAETAIPVAKSVSTIDAALADLLDADHAITVQDGADAAAGDVACGDIGGLLIGDELAIGLRPRNGSGYSGVALLRGDGDHTHVTIYLARDPAAPSDAGPATTGGTTTEVDIVGSGFSPAVVTVPVGSTVTWLNQDGIAHTIMGDDLAFDDSGVLEFGQRFSQTFEEPGTYSYRCGPHPWMTGTIIVE